MLARNERYSRTAIAFHWAIAVLALFNLALGALHESLPRSWNVMPVHKSVGMAVLVLTLGRLGWRLMHRPPALPAAMAAWERLSAQAMHWLLYALMLVLPLTGWIFSSNPEKLRPFTFFWLFDVPLLPVGAGLARTAKETHVLLGWTAIVLVLLHIAAALRHHYLLRDRVLLRMLP